MKYAEHVLKEKIILLSSLINNNEHFISRLHADLNKDKIQQLENENENNELKILELQKAIKKLNTT